MFAYALLRHFGLNPPTLRSSELWSDTQFTERVSEFEVLDIMMYNNNDEAYGAHVGVYIGGGLVYHLSLENGLPKYEEHCELLKQDKYHIFIGAKRVIKIS